jgi:hypothetical protein
LASVLAVAFHADAAGDDTAVAAAELAVKERLADGCSLPHYNLKE